MNREIPAGIKVVAFFSIILSLESLFFTWYMFKVPSLASVMVLVTIPLFFMFILGTVLTIRLQEAGRLILSLCSLAVGAFALLNLIPGIVLMLIEKEAPSFASFLGAPSHTIIGLGNAVYLCLPKIRKQFK